MTIPRRGISWWEYFSRWHFFSYHIEDTPRSTALRLTWSAFSRWVWPCVLLRAKISLFIMHISFLHFFCFPCSFSSPFTCFERAVLIQRSKRKTATGFTWYAALS